MEGEAELALTVVSMGRRNSDINIAIKLPVLIRGHSSISRKSNKLKSRQLSCQLFKSDHASLQLCRGKCVIPFQKEWKSSAVQQANQLTSNEWQHSKFLGKTCCSKHRLLLFVRFLLEVSFLS